MCTVTAARALAALRPRSTARRAVQGDCAAPFQGGSDGPPVGLSLIHI